LVELAQSPLSENDMLETLVMANDQVRMNQLKQSFENMPKQMQEPQFLLLPKNMQDLLVGSGYEIPSDKKKGLFERITTWDWPLLPEEHLISKLGGGRTVAGGLVTAGLAVPRAVGFGLGKVVGTGWEGLMKFSRFALHLQRSGAWLAEDSQWGNFYNPKRWWKSWQETEIESNSYSRPAMDEATDLIGSENARLLGMYLSSPQRLYDYFEGVAESTGNVAGVMNQYIEFEKKISTPNFVEARQILNGNRLDAFNYSIRFYNKNNLFLPDASPDSAYGKAVGITGSLATEILLDPLTYAGGAYTKIIRPARAGIRGSARSFDQVAFWEKLRAIQRESDNIKNFTGRIDDSQVHAWLNETSRPLVGGGFLRGRFRVPNLERLKYLNRNLWNQAKSQNRMADRINRAFKDYDSILDEVAKIDQDPSLTGAAREEAIDAVHRRYGNPLADLSRDWPSLDPIIGDMRRFHLNQRKMLWVRRGQDPSEVSTDLANRLIVLDDELAAARAMDKDFQDWEMIRRKEAERDEIIKKIGDRRLPFAKLWTDDIQPGTVYVGPNEAGEFVDFVVPADRIIPEEHFITDMTLSTPRGYDYFLASEVGQVGLATKAGGTGPEAMFIPRISAFGAQWVKRKKFMDEILDFGLPQHAVVAGMARMVGDFAAEQSRQMIALLNEAGVVNDLGKQLEPHEIRAILTAGLDDVETMSAARQAEAAKHGLTGEKFYEFEELIQELHSEAGRLVLESGEMSDLLQWYQDAGFQFADDGVTIDQAARQVPFAGMGRAARNYYDNRFHAASTANGEVRALERTGLITKSVAVAASYYPAKWAKKLTSYVPRQQYLDVLGDDAIREFKALVDMGSLAHMPRQQIDNLLEVFIHGNENQRWIVQTEFLLDFLGRSGALLMGGAEVQQYFSRFIRHAGAKYGLITGSDDVGLYGVSVKRAVIGGQAGMAQMSRANIIPNYAQLAVLAKHLSFYRRIGWGAPLAFVDKMFARIWRPMVLMRLGYVARNGGEELLSWTLREGPKGYVDAKSARSAIEQRVAYDAYGRKIQIDPKDPKHKELLKEDELLNLQMEQSLLFRPFTGFMRFVNELGGWGDMAITTKALQRAAVDTGVKWTFLEPDQMIGLFQDARHSLIQEMSSRPLSNIGRQMLVWGHGASNRYARFISRRAEALGIPKRSDLARKYLEKFDPDHELRVELATIMMSQPTMLDEQMKSIVGGYDTFLHFDKTGLDQLMRANRGVGATMDRIMRLPLDYTKTDLRMVRHLDGMNSNDYSIVISQNLSLRSDDPASQAAVQELIHYVSPIREQQLLETGAADRLVDTMHPVKQRQFRGHPGRPEETVPASPGEQMPISEQGIMEMPISTAYLADEGEPLTIAIGSLMENEIRHIVDTEFPRARTKEAKAEARRKFLESLQTAIFQAIETLPDGSIVRVRSGDWAEDTVKAAVGNMKAMGRTVHLETYAIPPTGPYSYAVTNRAGHMRNERLVDGIVDPDHPEKAVRADAVWSFYETELFGQTVQALDANLQAPAVASTRKLLQILNKPAGTEASFAATVGRLAEVINPTSQKDGVARVPKVGDTVALRIPQRASGNVFEVDPTADAGGATTAAGRAAEEELPTSVSRPYTEVGGTRDSMSDRVAVVEVTGVTIYDSTDPRINSIDTRGNRDKFIFDRNGAEVIARVKRSGLTSEGTRGGRQAEMPEGLGQKPDELAVPPSAPPLDNLNKDFLWKTGATHSRMNTKTRYLSTEDANKIVVIEYKLREPDVAAGRTKPGREVEVPGEIDPETGKTLKAPGPDMPMGGSLSGLLSTAQQRRVRIDYQAAFGDPAVVPTAVKQSGRYRRTRDGFASRGHTVEETVEGDQTVLRVYRKGTATGAEYIPAEPAVEPMSASATVLALFQDNAYFPAAAREKLLRAYNMEGSPEELSSAWNQAVDEALDLVPPQYRDIWEDVLRPRKGGYRPPPPSGLLGPDGRPLAPSAAPAAPAPDVQPPVRVYGGEGPKQENLVLSNFDTTSFEFRGQVYPSAEHAYQVHKSKTVELNGKPILEHIERLDPQAAKKWAQGKIEVDKESSLPLMREILEAKFEQVPEFREALLATRGRKIVHPVGDTFWKEKFPELLMDLRDRHLDDAPAAPAAAPAAIVNDLPVPDEYLGDLSGLYDYETGELITENPTVGDLVAKADELEGEFWAKVEQGLEINTIESMNPDEFTGAYQAFMGGDAEYVYTGLTTGGAQSIFRQLAKQGEIEVPYIVSDKGWEAGDDLWEAYVDDFLTRYPDKDPIIFLSRELEEFPSGGYRESGAQWSHLDAIGQSVREWLEGYALRKTAMKVADDVPAPTAKPFDTPTEAVTPAGNVVRVTFLPKAPGAKNPPNVEHHQGAIDLPTASEMSQEIMAHGGWTDHPKLRGATPRVHIQGDPGTGYFYSGHLFVNDPETGLTVVHPWSPVLLDIKERVEEITGYRFNLVLAQRYTEKEKLGFHYDRKQHYDRDTGLVIAQPHYPRGVSVPGEEVVVSVNVGDTRTFGFASDYINARGREQIINHPNYLGGVELGHGDILVMSDDVMRPGVLHSIIPSEGAAQSRRINLTFRRVGEDVESAPRDPERVPQVDGEAVRPPDEVEYTEEMAQQEAYEEEVMAGIPEEHVDEFGEEMDPMEKDALFRMEEEMQLGREAAPAGPSPTPVTLIISGGQTGGDLGGLRGAETAGIPTGGGATQGYRMEGSPHSIVGPEMTPSGGSKETQSAAYTKRAELLGDRFGLSEGLRTHYMARTSDNIDNADATLIFYPKQGDAGTGVTEMMAEGKRVGYAKGGGIRGWVDVDSVPEGTVTGETFAIKGEPKPVLVVNVGGEFFDKPTEIAKVRKWLVDNNVETLNIAGNRASKGGPGFEDAVADFVAEVLRADTVPAPTAGAAVPPSAPPPPPSGPPVVPTGPVQRDNLGTNMTGFLLSGADPKALSSDFDEITDRARKAIINFLSSPAGQHYAHSMARANIGTSADTPMITHPVDSNTLRYYVPMISSELVEDLNDVLIPLTNDLLLKSDKAESLAGAAKAAEEFRDIFVTTLLAKLDALGIPRTDPVADHARLLLNPAVTIPRIGGSATDYMKLAAHYAEAGDNYFPLVTASTDGRIANAIGEALLETIAYKRGVSVSELPPVSLRTRDVDGREFYNSEGGVQLLGAPSKQTFGAIYYGYGPNGPAPAASFGTGGLSNNKVFGIGAHDLTMSPKRPLRPVPVVGGEPRMRRLSVYKHKAGEKSSVVARAGSEMEVTHFENSDEWELLETQFASGDDLFDFIEEQALLNTMEILELLSNASRAGTDPIEVFYPWMREVTSGKVSSSRVQYGAEYHDGAVGGWFPNAPSELQGWFPTASEAPGIGDKWASFTRHWFDGTISPMLGAMIREPIFLHYLVKAWKQTEGIRKFHFHTAADVKNLKHLGSLDRDGQLVIDTLEDLIKLDWPTAHLDVLDDGTPSDLAKLVGALESDNPRSFKAAVRDLLDKDELAKEGDIEADWFLPKEKVDFWRSVLSLEDSDLEQFVRYARGRKAGFDLHRDTALKRAMTLTGSFIDDHSIRSQFQEMVRTAIPFWFAEDTFLRRQARGLAHNPLMFRRLNLMMNAMERGGVIQEDSQGNKWLTVPGNEMLTTNVLEIVEDFPVVGKIFGAPLGAVLRPAAGGGFATNINVVPGYNADTVGSMGFGPILAVPLNFLGNFDATIRPQFEKNMVGGKWTPDSTLNQFWTSAIPSLIVKPTIAMFGQVGLDIESVTKAQVDVIKARALRGDLPTEEFIAAQPNPELYVEQLMEEIAQEARHYLWFQTATWWLGPGTGRSADLIVDAESQNWNDEFYSLLRAGMPWEEAYRTWVDNIESTGEKFNPFQYSPFMPSRTTKVPFAVLESTDNANKWIVDNNSFLDTYKYASAFFMPRSHGKEIDEFSAEAHARLLGLGLREKQAPLDFLEELYYKRARARYFKVRAKYNEDLFAAKNAGLPTVGIEAEWDANQKMFLQSNPIFMKRFTSGDARGKRDKTISELEVLVTNPDLVPNGENKGEVLLAAAMVIDFVKSIDRLQGLQGGEVQRARDALRIEAFNRMTEYCSSRPFLNELYYSVFLPELGDAWVGKFNAGLIEV